MQHNEAKGLFRRNSLKMNAVLIGLMVLLAAGGGHDAKLFNRAEANDDEVSREEFRPFADWCFARFRCQW